MAFALLALLCIVDRPVGLGCMRMSGRAVRLVHDQLRWRSTQIRPLRPHGDSGRGSVAPRPLRCHGHGDSRPNCSKRLWPHRAGFLLFGSHGHPNQRSARDCGANAFANRLSGGARLGLTDGSGCERISRFRAVRCSKRAIWYECAAIGNLTPTDSEGVLNLSGRRPASRWARWRQPD